MRMLIGIYNVGVLPHTMHSTSFVNANSNHTTGKFDIAEKVVQETHAKVAPQIVPDTVSCKDVKQDLIFCYQNLF